MAIDCSEKAIRYAEKEAQEEHLLIEHFVRNSNDLFGFRENTFDIVLCSMMLMDCEDFEGTIKEVVRVLKPAGRLFASVLHPCFNGNYEKGIGRLGSGLDRQVVIKNYFEPKQWEGTLTGGKTPIIWHHRTLEEYIKTFIKCGLTIVDINEPRATEEQAETSATLAFLRRVPLYLYWELKK